MLPLFLAACGKAPEPPAPPPAARDETPVIIYLIDTLRADRLGLYGYDKPTSPTIDALAKESVVFERAHAAGPWTLPSTASLLTSRYPCEHGVRKVRLRLSPALPTLAERMQSLGHATGLFYRNKLIGSSSNLYRGHQVAEFVEPKQREFNGGVIDFLEKSRGMPFYLHVHTMEPHNVYMTPAEFIKPFGFVSVDDREKYRARYDSYRLLLHTDITNERPVGTTDTTAAMDRVSRDLLATRDQVSLLYDASVRYADAQLAEVVAALREKGLWDRALFILLADHGEELYEHGLWFHDHSVYEELIHVPLLVHFPKGAHGGTRVGERVSLLDVMPTVLDYLGRAELCENCRGSSLLPLVEGREGYRGQDLPAMRHNVSGYYRPLKEAKGDVNVVVREGALKGIWNEEPDRVELYDLAADPAERTDLGATRGAEAQAMAGRARQWLESCRAMLVPPEEMPKDEMTDELRQQLRAHGYFGG